MLAVAALVVAVPAALGATVASVVSPANGTALLLTPPSGFANLDHPLTWTIAYDCPGPDDIHSSFAQRRPVGAPDWQAQTRDGPFEGDGTFSTPSSFFPVATPAMWEWRVFWACGATNGFPGAQGTSEAVTFSVALPPAPAPPPPPAPPAPPAAPAPPAVPVTTPTDPCAGRTRAALVICRSAQRRAKALKACAARRGAAKKAACRRRATAAHRRTVRLQACRARTGTRRAACVRAANRAYRRAIR